MNDDLGVDFNPQQFDEIQRQAQQQMQVDATATNATACLLYTSDAADE